MSPKKSNRAGLIPMILQAIDNNKEGILLKSDNQNNDRIAFHKLFKDRDEKVSVAKAGKSWLFFRRK